MPTRLNACCSRTRNPQLGKQTASRLPAIVTASAEYPVPRSANELRPVWAEHRRHRQFETGALWECSRRSGVIEILRVMEGENGTMLLVRGLDSGYTRRLSYRTLIREYRPCRW